MHRDIVFSYPPGVEALGSSPSCEVQGMYKPGRFISVQGHPEFNEGIMHDILQTRHDQGVFDDALFEDAKRRAGNSHDGVAVAGAFLRFLQE
jgi:GMP synthase-like glutamine amidotransferase